MEIRFNASQERLADFVIKEVEKTDQQIISGCGLTGVGKNTVLRELSSEIQRKGGQVVPLAFLLDPSNEELIKDAQTHFVTSLVPREFESLQYQVANRLGLIVVGVRVKPMNLDETLEYIEGMRRSSGITRSTKDLDDNALATLTMGIYGHLNKYFELKARGKSYHPSAIREALRRDFPEYLRSGRGFYEYLSQLTDIPYLWGQMGI